MFRHIVLFRVRDDIEDIEERQAVDDLRSLGDAAGALSWRVERSLDPRKGRMIVEDATFASRAAFESFRTSPAHRAAAERLAAIADWWIGDYEV